MCGWQARHRSWCLDGNPGIPAVVWMTGPAFQLMCGWQAVQELLQAAMNGSVSTVQVFSLCRIGHLDTCLERCIAYQCGCTNTFTMPARCFVSHPMRGEGLSPITALDPRRCLETFFLLGRRACCREAPTPTPRKTPRTAAGAIFVFHAMLLFDRCCLTNHATCGMLWHYMRNITRNTCTD